MAQSFWPYGVLQSPSPNVNPSVGDVRGTTTSPCSCQQLHARSYIHRLAQHANMENNDNG